MAIVLSPWSITEKERESAEPEELVEPFLTRFVGKFIRKTIVFPSFLTIRC